MPYTFTNGWCTNMYPNLVSSYYGLADAAHRYHGGHPGFRTNEVRYILDDSYSGDDYTNHPYFTLGYGGYNLQTLNDMKASFRAALSKADLVTINLGSNDLMGYYWFAVQEVLQYHSVDDACYQQTLQAIEKAKQASSEYEAVVRLLDYMSTLADYTELVKNVAERITELVLSYTSNWDKLMESILNTASGDAAIIVVGLYNPVGAAAQVSSGISDTAAELLTTLKSPVVDLINAYMRSGCPYSSSYAFADVSDIDLAGSGDGKHPGVVGHRYMADQIIQTINSTLPCTHGNTVLVNCRAAGKLTLGYSGDLVCADCGETVEKGHMTMPTLLSSAGSMFEKLFHSTVGISLLGR